MKIEISEAKYMLGEVKVPRRQGNVAAEVKGRSEKGGREKKREKREERSCWAEACG